MLLPFRGPILAKDNVFRLLATEMTEEEFRQIGSLMVVPSSPPRPLPDPEEFLKRFRGGRESGVALTGELLDEAVRSRSAEDVEGAMVVGATFGFSVEHLDYLVSLAFEDCHFGHEAVASALGDLKSPRAVDALCHLTQWIPDYLDYDDYRALAVKAIWALGGIEGKEADEALDRLAYSTVLRLAKTARKQINRRRMPGWSPQSPD